MNELSMPFTPKECMRLQRKFSEDELENLENTVYGTRWLGKYNFWINHRPFGSHLITFKAITPLDILSKLLTKKIILDFSETYTLRFGNKSIKSDISVHDCLYRAGILFLSDIN